MRRTQPELFIVEWAGEHFTLYELGAGYRGMLSPVYKTEQEARQALATLREMGKAGVRKMRKWMKKGGICPI